MKSLWTTTATDKITLVPWEYFGCAFFLFSSTSGQLLYEERFFCTEEDEEEEGKRCIADSLVYIR